jgi:outer membrane protein assembly factor BamB
MAWLGALACALAAGANDLESQRWHNWHQWRGPSADGIAYHAHAPRKWDENTNIQWKVEIPGSGTSTPIVWNDRLYLTTAINTGQRPESALGTGSTAGEDGGEQQAERPSGQQPAGRGDGGGGRPGGARPDTLFQFVVLCLDRQSGKVVWQHVATETVPHEGHHRDHGYASASATTDGQSLFVSFGSRGIYCYDLEGNLRWSRELGRMRTRSSFGEGTSPVVHGDSLIVNWDHEDDSFIVCLDTATGQDKWRVNRDEATSWTTPLVIEHKGVTQVIVNGANRTRSYDLTNGELIWECGGQTGNPIPSLVTANGVVYCMTGFRGFALKAISLDAKGDVTGTDQVKWERDRGTPYVPSPLLYDGLLYFTRANNGILTCVRADTGEELYADQRLQETPNIYSSLTYAQDKVYITGRDGATLVLKHGPAFEVLATNKLDEGIDASAVFVGNQLFLRGARHLYCIAEKE